MESKNKEDVGKKTSKMKQIIAFFTQLFNPILMLFGKSKFNPESATTPEPIETVLEDQNTNVAALINSSLDACHQMDYQKCIDFCNAAIAIDSNAYIAYNNKCYAYILLKQYDESIEAGEKAVSINPNYPYSIGNLQWARNEKTKEESTEK